MLQLEDDGSGFFFCRKAELFAVEDGILPAAAKMEQGNGESPAFSRGEVAACMEEGRKGSDPLKITRCSEHDFAAPDRSVRTVACAVETHADDGGEMIVLRHDGEHMRVVMLHLEDGKPQGFGEAARFVARMKVGGDGGGSDREQTLHARQGLAQRSEGAQIAHIAEIGRGVEERILGKAESVLEFAADAENRALEIGREHQGQRRVAAAASNHIRRTVVEIHDAVIGAQTNLAVVREDEVGDGRKRVECVLVRTADRRSRRVAARHDETICEISEFVGQGKEQKVQRRVGQHDAERGHCGCDACSDFSAAAFFQ